MRFLKGLRKAGEVHLGALAALAFGASAAYADAPRRVVSFNLCADQLVIALSDPAQIVGLSPFAVDPGLSVVAQEAQPYPRPLQRAEATVALKPDLVLVGPNDRSAMRRVLADLGINVREVAVVNDIAGAREQVRAVAALLGQESRGAALIAAIDAAAARLAAVARPSGETALVVERRGYVAGPGSLAASLLAAGGLQAPAGAPAGLGGFVSMERLLTLRPDFLVLHEPVQEARDQGAAFLAHPALAAFYPRERWLVFPRRYSLCGGPALVAALDYLARVLPTVPQR